MAIEILRVVVVAALVAAALRAVQIRISLALDPERRMMPRSDPPRGPPLSRR